MTPAGRTVAATAARRTAARVLLVVLALTGAVTLAAQDRVPPDTGVAPLWAPGAVQQRDVTTAAHNDSLVQAIEHSLKCTCGCNLDIYTCRTTDFTCATSPALHRSVVARLDSALAAGFNQAQAARRVVEQFEAQYGQMIHMAPPKRGFNWTAYIVPFVGLGIGLGIVVGLMRRWMAVRRRDEAEAVPSGTPAGLASADAERLQRELEHFEA